MEDTKNREEVLDEWKEKEKNKIDSLNEEQVSEEEILVEGE